MHAPGFMSTLLILAVVVLLFGGKKLPELGGALGEAIKNFKKGIKDEEATPAPTAAAQPVMEKPKELPASTVATQSASVSDQAKT